MITPKLVTDDSLASKFYYIRSLNNLSFVKDVNSVYQSVSKCCCDALGWNSTEDAIDKTDYDIPSDISLLADHFINLDKQSFAKNSKILTLDINNFQDVQETFLVEKMPLFNHDGDIIGIYGNVLDVSNVNFFKYGAMLSREDQKIAPLHKVTSYVLSGAHSPLPLTDRQQECVFFLIRGKTAKEIANILMLSVRTVESYIEAIKYRLGCTHKSQIVEKAINSKFLYYIPESLLKANPSKIIA